VATGGEGGPYREAKALLWLLWFSPAWLRRAICNSSWGTSWTTPPTLRCTKLSLSTRRTTWYELALSPFAQRSRRRRPPRTHSAALHACRCAQVHVGVGVTEAELATLIALLKPGGTLVSTARAFGSPRCLWRRTCCRLLGPLLCARMRTSGCGAPCAAEERRAWRGEWHSRGTAECRALLAGDAAVRQRWKRAAARPNLPVQP
jgi:hypothetical protein